MLVWGEQPALRIVPGEESEYGHFFGGPAVHDCARLRAKDPPLHLLYCLNLADPLLSWIRRPKGVQWLPLYYGFRYNDCQLGYLLESRERITLFHRKQKFFDDWPYPAYPSAFPKQSVRVELMSYEERKTVMLAHMLLEEEYDYDLKLLSPEDRNLLKSWGYPFTQLGGSQFLIQGPPASRCPNPSCRRHKDEEPLVVLAVIRNQPVAGVSLWGEEGEFVQVVFEQCAGCGSIYVSNQCD